MICPFCKAEIYEPTVNNCPHCNKWNSSPPDTMPNKRKPVVKVLLAVSMVIVVSCFIVYTYNIQNSALRTVSRFLSYMNANDYDGISSLLYVEGAPINKDTAKAFVAWLDSQPAKEREMRTTLIAQATATERNNGHPTGNFVANPNWALVSNDSRIFRSFKVRVRLGEININALGPGQILISGVMAQPMELKGKPGAAFSVLPGIYKYQLIKTEHLNSDELPVIKNTITVGPGQHTGIYVPASVMNKPGTVPKQNDLPL